MKEFRRKLGIRNRIRFLLKKPLTIPEAITRNCNLYLGNLTEELPQYKTGNFAGLALQRLSHRDLIVDLRKELPFESESISKIQAEDVLEHLEFDDCISLLNECFRLLIPGSGIIRISVPDYRSIVLKKRSVYNANGTILGDLLTSTEVKYCKECEELAVIKSCDGNSHLWFPQIENVQKLVSSSDFRNSNSNFYQYYKSDNSPVNEKYPDLDMPVSRTPPNDMRAGGNPISIVFDLHR
jgi:predicted SAM-dependent methyltransferase